MKMTKTLTTFMLLTSLCFSSLLSAEEVVIPVVTKPSVLQEGTQRELSAEQIQELIPWAKNSKVFLNDLLSSLQGLSSVDKLDRLEVGIESVVNESAPKNSELLMRYVLNRGLVINELLKKETAAEEVGSIDTKLRVLISSVNMAIAYYDTDMNTLTKKTNAPFIAFGVNYFEFLSELNKSIFDASASYNIQRTALEWLQWDLYRDLNNQQFASQIVKINNSLKLHSTNRMSDTQYISHIRQMKLMASQLNIDPSKIRARIQYNKDEELDVKNSSNFSSNYISECSKVMSSNSSKNSCVALAKDIQVHPKLLLLCGNMMSSDAHTYACIQAMSGQSANNVTVKSYQACKEIMSSGSSTLSCINLVNAYGPKVQDMKQCGSSRSSDSSTYTCVETVGANKERDNLADMTRVCASIMSSDSSAGSCLNLAIAYSLEISDLNACNSFSSDSHVYSCLETIGKTGTMGNSADIISACTSVMSSNSSALSCMGVALGSSRIDTNGIKACNQMGSDAHVYSCIINL